VTKFRVARPTLDFDPLRSFYLDGLGLVDLGGFEDHQGYDGWGVGTGDESYELEFTKRVGDVAHPPPCADNLVVFYYETRAEIDEIAARFEAMGVQPVEPINPYWAGKSYTFEDPDGWRVVVFDWSVLGG
jgi:catechol 2,3-dioxygenase-like lactoylglutathione lyase family enzyme